MNAVHNSENHTLPATGGGKVIAMVYDAFGNRVSKTVNGVTTQYLVEDDVNPTGLPQVLEEVQGGAAVRTYTYGLQRISEEQVVNNAWTPSFYVYDGAGSVRQLTNSAGAVTDSYEYDAYGNSFTTQGTTPNNYLYRGEQYDADLGLYYLRARFYNPLTGRFLSRDPEDGIPTDPASLHKYVYAGGDPVNRIDPSGRAEVLEFSELTLSDVVKATVGVVAVGGAIECLYEYVETKFDYSVAAAMYGEGNVFQQSPCVWLWTVAKNEAPWPYPVTPGQPIPGTPASPPPPQCPELRAAVVAAKSVVGSLGKCIGGMSPWQLQIRYNAWVGLGAARAAEDQVCWNGGNLTHQQEEANAWEQAANCAALTEAW